SPLRGRASRRSASVLLPRRQAAVVRVHHGDLEEVVRVLDRVDRLELAQRREPRGDHGAYEAGDGPVLDEPSGVIAEVSLWTASASVKPVWSRNASSRRRSSVATSSTSPSTAPGPTSGRT